MSLPGFLTGWRGERMFIKSHYFGLKAAVQGEHINVVLSCK